MKKADFQLADDMATIKRGIEARVATNKGDLKQWLHDACDPADDTPVSLALLETAFDRYLDNFPVPDAFEMIEAVFRRAVRRRRSTCNSSIMLCPSLALGPGRRLPACCPHDRLGPRGCRRIIPTRRLLA